MNEFIIPSTTGVGSLQFYNRSPFDSTEPIECFWVRVTELNLSASGQVWIGYTAGNPARLFAEMAARWTGWPGVLEWGSLEEELFIRCRHDGRGHIFIRVILRSGPMDNDWEISSTIMAEAGQLDDIARRAASFFGRER